MAWSISITPEGGEELYEACAAASKNFLWQALKENARQRQIKGHSGWRLRDYTHEQLVEAVYQLIQQTDTCDNGGYKFWIDPAGYYKITLP